MPNVQDGHSDEPRSRAGRAAAPPRSRHARRDPENHGEHVSHAGPPRGSIIRNHGEHVSHAGPPRGLHHYMKRSRTNVRGDQLPSSFTSGAIRQHLPRRPRRCSMCSVHGRVQCGGSSHRACVPARVRSVVVCLFITRAYARRRRCADVAQVEHTRRPFSASARTHSHANARRECSSISAAASITRLVGHSARRRVRTCCGQRIAEWSRAIAIRSARFPRFPRRLFFSCCSDFRTKHRARTNLEDRLACDVRRGHRPSQLLGRRRSTSTIAARRSLLGARCSALTGGRPHRVRPGVSVGADAMSATGTLTSRLLLRDLG
jgi:hypothetical protein